MTRFDNAYEEALRTARSSRDIAKEFGINKETVNKHRRLRGISTNLKNQHSAISAKPDVSDLSGGSYTTGDSSGNFGEGWLHSRAVTARDAEDWVRSAGKDPADYDISFSANAYGQGLFSNKVAARPKQSVSAYTMPPADEMLEVIRNYRPTVTINKGYTDFTFVVCAADFQIGKTDYGNGTEDTIRRVLDSFAKAAQYAEKHAFKEIVLTDLGDIVENFCNTSSQRGTNDRALTEQIRIARRLMLQAVLMFAPLTERLTYLAIPSNHGSVRLGPKSPENHVLDDYGIEIAEQIRDVAEHSDKLQNLQVIIPEVSMESLAYTTQDGTTLGLVHGHQASNPNGLSKWWAGQDHGRMPTAGADILLVGHYHSLKVEQSGDARWIFVAPTSDNGSSWFRNKTGQDSKSGILTMTIKAGQWSNLVIQ